MVDSTLMSEVNETLEEAKKRIKREKHRDYMRKRRSEDPEFNEKQKELNRNRKKYLYHNDQEFKEKQKEYGRQYARKALAEKLELKNLYEDLKKSIQNV